MAEVKLMKGNEVLAEAAIRCGCDAYYGYPITPQSEVMEKDVDVPVLRSLQGHRKRHG